MGHPSLHSVARVAMLRGSLFARPLLEHSLYVASSFATTSQRLSKITLLLVAFGFLMSGCTESAQEEFASISPEVFKAKLAATDNPQILDVRTPGEIAAGNIKGHTALDYMDLSEAEFLKGIEQFDKDEPIFVYCKSGGRSKKACSLLEQAGFSEIYELDGGFISYQE